MRKVFLLLLLLPSLASAQTSSITGTNCPGNGCISYAVAGQGSVGIQITGTWSGTITFYGSVSTSGSATYVTLGVTPINSTTAVTTTTANGIWAAPIAGLSQLRVAFTSYTSGTASVLIRTTTAARKGNGNGGGGGGSVDSVGLSAPSDVFNVANSPVTSTGTIDLTFDTQSANRVFAGPTTGSPATPAFRQLVAADISGLVGAGTVTSVAMTLPTSVFDLTGSPITSNGTFAATFDNQTANTFFAGPTGGGATTPAFRALNANDLTGLVAPTTATYITQTANANLSNEQALGLLATGILKSTTTTGVVSIAASSDTIAQWSGTCNASSVLGGDGTCAGISTDFDVVTSGTNTVAAMVIGSGASLTTTGTGTNAANYISNLGTDPPASGDCDDAGETGKLFWNSDEDDLYICSGASGWRKIATAAP